MLLRVFSVSFVGSIVIALLTACSQPNRKSKIRIFCEMIEENYIKIGGAATDAFCTAKGITTEAQRKQLGANVMCSNDGYIVFHDSDLLCGQVGKNVIGKEAKSSLFYILTRDHLPEDAVECMTRLSKFCARWLTLQGYDCAALIGSEIYGVCLFSLTVIFQIFLWDRRCVA